MYGEPFAVPEPLETVFITWYEGGEVFRSGLTWRRGAGKIFYFSPGHEIYPIYHQPEIQKILRNAVGWAHSPRRAGRGSRTRRTCRPTGRRRRSRAADRGFMPTARRVFDE